MVGIFLLFIEWIMTEIYRKIKNENKFRIEMFYEFLFI